MAVKSTLFDFWQDKEKEWGRDITVVEVAKFVGSSRDPIIRLRDNTVKNPSLEICGKICKFFGCPPGPVPFIIYEPD